MQLRNFTFGFATEGKGTRTRHIANLAAQQMRRVNKSARLTRPPRLSPFAAVHDMVPFIIPNNEDSTERHAGRACYSSQPSITHLHR